jgi:hypothetical protein
MAGPDMSPIVKQPPVPPPAPAAAPAPAPRATAGAGSGPSVVHADTVPKGSTPLPAQGKAEGVVPSSTFVDGAAPQTPHQASVAAEHRLKVAEHQVRDAQRRLGDAEAHLSATEAKFRAGAMPEDYPLRDGIIFAETDVGFARETLAKAKKEWAAADVAYRVALSDEFPEQNMWPPGFL